MVEPPSRRRPTRRTRRRPGSAPRSASFRNAGIPPCAVRDPIDAESYEGDAASRFGPIVPFVPASASVWQLPQPDPEEDLLARGGIACGFGRLGGLRRRWLFAPSAVVAVGWSPGEVLRLEVVLGRRSLSPGSASCATSSAPPPQLGEKEDGGHLRDEEHDADGDEEPERLPGNVGRDRGMTSATTSANTMNASATTRRPSRTRSAPAATT